MEGVDKTKLIQAVWPDWQVIRRLGEGSYGTVFEAKKQDHQVVSHSAIKVISIPKSQAELETIQAEGMGEEGTRTYLSNVVDSFVAEIQLMDALKGVQNVVSVEDYKVIEHHDRLAWDILIRMELLTPFPIYKSSEPNTEALAIRLGIDICRALERCAIKKIIHRDIKPENIFVNSFGDFKLGDFGIARQLENMSSGLSQKGTYNYLAPEIERSKYYDARVDIYSLGIVLYRLMNYDRLPFITSAKQAQNPSERTNALRRRLSGEKLPPPPQASPRLAAIILKACSYYPENRYANATQMRNDLETLLGSLRTNNPIEAPGEKTEPPSSGMTPTMSRIQPVQPAVKPVQPAVKPVQPAVKPVRPAVKPVQPAVKPVQPAVKPVQPASGSRSTTGAPIQTMSGSRVIHSAPSGNGFMRGGALPMTATSSMAAARTPVPSAPAAKKPVTPTPAAKTPVASAPAARTPVSPAPVAKKPSVQGTGHPVGQMPQQSMSQPVGAVTANGNLVLQPEKKKRTWPFSSKEAEKGAAASGANPPRPHAPVNHPPLPGKPANVHAGAGAMHPAAPGNSGRPSPAQAQNGQMRPVQPAKMQQTNLQAGQFQSNQTHASQTHASQTHASQTPSHGQHPVYGQNPRTVNPGSDRAVPNGKMPNEAVPYREDQTVAVRSINQRLGSSNPSTAPVDGQTKQHPNK